MSKATRVTIWSIKGGVGKTTLALEISYALDIAIITNEEHTILSSILEGDKLMILTPKEEIPLIDSEYDIIFDMAGGVHKDKRVKEALEQSSVIVIPSSTKIPDIKGAISTLKEIEKMIINKNVIIVINQYKDKEELKEVIEYFNKFIEKEGYKNVSITTIKYSKALERDIYKKKKSISEIRKENPLSNYTYRKIGEEIDELKKLIVSCKDL